jgi:positive regulator of sigma E activity
MQTELSDKSKRICRQNYKSNCGSCPIRNACVSVINGKLNEWTNRVNQLAEECESK